MNVRRGLKQRRANLLVKEVVVPEKPGASCSNFCPDGPKVGGGDHEITGLKTGRWQDAEQIGLTVLKKPPENYFEGTKKKKKTVKRKVKHRKRELFSDGMQTLSKGDTPSIKKEQSEKSLTEEEKTEMKLLCEKIYEYEKKREEIFRKSCLKQKKAEEDYICQLENLVAVWFDLKGRSCVTKHGSFQEETPCSKNRNKISVASKKYRKGKSGCERLDKGGILEGECSSAQTQSPEDVLSDQFNEKLILVDENSDEFGDCPNVQIKRDLRKL